MSPDKGQKNKETFCCEICMLAFKQMKDAMQFLAFYFNMAITEVVFTECFSDHDGPCM